MKNNDKKTNKEEKVKKNLNNKKIILYIALFIIVALVITIICLILNKNSSKNSSSSALVCIDSRSINELDFNNISLNKEGELYIITAEVVNNTQEERGNFDLGIVLKKSDGEDILTLGDFVPSLKPTEKYNIKTVVQFDLTEVKDIDIVNINEKNIELKEGE